MYLSTYVAVCHDLRPSDVNKIFDMCNKGYFQSLKIRKMKRFEKQISAFESGGLILWFMTHKISSLFDIVNKLLFKLF